MQINFYCVRFPAYVKKLLVPFGINMDYPRGSSMDTAPSGFIGREIEIEIYLR